jgi:hypothetical protein
MNVYILRVLFVIGMIILCAWIIHHSYNQWFQSEKSVLDKYKEQADEDLIKAGSLDDLLRKYDEAHKKVKAYESNKANPILSLEERLNTEPYKSKIILQDEIQSRESDARKLFKVRYYWFMGLVFSLSGLVFYRKFNELLGMSLMIVGFTEMIAITEPVRYDGSFGDLTTNKLVLSFITIIMLIISSYLLSIMKNETELQSEDKK